MKAKIFSLILGLTVVGQITYAQSTVYRMHITMQDGTTYSVMADEVKEVYFTASEPYDPTNPVTADVSLIHAPKEGGTYTVHINTTIPLTTENGQANPISVDNIFNHFLNQSPVNLTSSYTDGTLSITVHPTTNRIVESVSVKLYDLEGTEAFSLTVSQDGDPNATLIGEYGDAYISTMAKALVNSHAKYRTADL